MLLVKQAGTKEQAGENGHTVNTSELGKKITAAGLLSILEQQGYRCAMTGRPLTPDLTELDHILPLSRGGKNTLDNVQAVHCEVNQAKGAMLIEDFIELCREVTAWAQTEK